MTRNTACPWCRCGIAAPNASCAVCARLAFHAEKMRRQVCSAAACRTPDRTWMTDEQLDGGWANAVRAYEEVGCG